MDKTFPHTGLKCGKSLTGRSDKKFCSAECRVHFYNRHKRKNDRVIAAANRQIRKNRTILKALCPDGKATVRRSLLDDQGF